MVRVDLVVAKEGGGADYAGIGCPLKEGGGGAEEGGEERGVDDE